MWSSGAIAANCNSRKSLIKACAPMKLGTIVSRPMQRIAMDIVGPFPETRRGNGTFWSSVIISPSGRKHFQQRIWKLLQ